LFRGAHGAPRAVSGASPETSTSSGAAADPGPKSGAARAGAEVPARAPEPAREARALPGAADDPFLEYAAWLSINELAKPWTDAIIKGDWKIEGREDQLAYGLTAIDPQIAGRTLAAILKERPIARDGGGPWIELIGKAGVQGLIDQLYEQFRAGGFDRTGELRALQGLAEAARLRQLKPAAGVAEFAATLRTLSAAQPQDPAFLASAIRLAGQWKLQPALTDLVAFTRSEEKGVQSAAFEAIRLIGGAEAEGALTQLASTKDHPLPVRKQAASALLALDVARGAALLPSVFEAISDEQEALELWRSALQVKGAPEKLAANFERKPDQPASALPKTIANAGLRAAREAGKKGEALAKVLAPLAGVSAAEAKPFQSYGWMADFTKRDGDPARGELVYRRANLGCVTCHAIGGAGGKVGPEMTSLGASAPLDYIIEAVLDPGAKVKEGFNAVNFTLKDNTQVMGIQARETANEVFVRDVAGNEQALVKTNIASKTDIGSIMPAGLVEQLPERERWDLFAFLGELGKPGGFDASKGMAARRWVLFPAVDRERVLKGDLESANAAQALTFVDGWLTRELLAEALQLVPNPGEAVYAVARFQSSGRTNLKLTGAAAAWLNGQPLDLTQPLAPDLPPANICSWCSSIRSSSRSGCAPRPRKRGSSGTKRPPAAQTCLLLRRLVHAEVILDAAVDRCEAHRLREEGEPGDHLPAFFFRDDRREEDDGHMLQERIGTDLLRHFAAVDLRHHDIEEDDVRPELAGGEPRFRAIVFLEHVIVPGFLEGQFEQPGEAGFIIDNKDAFFGHKQFGGQTWNIRVTRAPPSGRLRKSIVAPWRSMIVFTTDKPRPVPCPVGFVVKKGSKIFASLSSGMPGPVSSISATTMISPTRNDSERLSAMLRPTPVSCFE
jgi:putative heme-binding domain-containing protein